MAENSAQERTEAASPRKREEAKKKGQVPKSREVASVAVLLAALGALYFSGPWMLSEIQELMAMTFLGMEQHHITQAMAQRWMMNGFVWGTRLILPLLITVAAAGLAANVLQAGFLFTTESLIPRFSRMDPLQGLKRLYSLRSLNELLKSLLKLLVVGTVGFSVVRHESEGIPGMIDMPIDEILLFTSHIAVKTGLYTSIVLILIAILDYSFQKWQHEKDLRMTKQEMKEEAKHTEGDPLIKSRIRRVQMEMARRRMMQKVPLADVVITNPTHLAVALMYRAQEMDAPRVVAKGAGYLALKIREIAERHQVPIVENKPLAQALFKGADVDDIIPIELYHAVAETLAYVYRLKGRTL